MSKKYFEINLPETAPSHVVGTGTRKVVTDILVTVHKRMEKLEEAQSDLYSNNPCCKECGYNRSEISS